MINISIPTLIQALNKLPDPKLGEKCYLKIPDPINCGKFSELTLEGKFFEMVEWVIIDVMVEL